MNFDSLILKTKSVHLMGPDGRYPSRPVEINLAHIFNYFPFKFSIIFPFIIPLPSVSRRAGIDLDIARAQPTADQATAPYKHVPFENNWAISRALLSAWA